MKRRAVKGHADRAWVRNGCRLKSAFIHDLAHELSTPLTPLAGYLRILSEAFLRQFAGVVLNIHPSLLPDFPGLGAAARQWRAGVRVAGATVHYVDAGVDTGPILLSGSLEVRGDEGEAGLAQRILTEVEHVIYPRAVWLLCARLANPGGQEEPCTTR